VLHHTSEQIGDATSTTMQNLVAPSSEPELLTASTEIGQNHVESDAVLSHLTQVAIPSSEQSQAIHAQADQCNAPIMVSDIKQEPMEFYPQASMNGEIPKLVSKSGNWFQTVDSLGQIYYYHRETRLLIYNKSLPITEC
jgi:hypothetical protein